MVYVTLIVLVATLMLGVAFGFCSSRSLSSCLHLSDFDCVALVDLTLDALLIP